MSKLGRKLINLPAGVTVTVEGGLVVIKGPKGELKYQLIPGVKISQAEGGVKITTTSATPKAILGLAWSLVAGMVQGVSQGFEKKLELVGSGYRAKLEAGKLYLTIGLSHPVVIEPPAGIELKVEGNNLIGVSGIDKQMVGQVAAMIRKVKPPEPYKGKGVRYVGEQVRKKAGKATKAVGAVGGATA